MNELNIFIAPMFLSFLVSFLLVVFVYGSNPKSIVNRLFSVSCMLLGFFTFLDFAVRITRDSDLKLFWVKCGFFWPIFISVLLHFSIAFTEKSKSIAGKILVISGYSIGFLFSSFEAVLALRNGGAIMRMHWLLRYKLPGWLLFYNIENLWMLAILLITSVVQIAYFVEIRDPLLKAKAKFILAGFLFSSIVSSIAFLSLDFVPPQYLFIMHFPPLVGNIIISYGIWKHDVFMIDASTTAENIVSTITDALFIVDVHGHIKKTNNAAIDLSGYPPENLLRLPFQKLFFDRPDFEHMIDVLYRTGRIVSRDAKTVTANRSIMSVSLSASVLTDNLKRAFGAVFIIRDISEKVRLLKDKKSLYEQLAQLQKMEAIGQLAGGIAHDFNNCLAAILLSAEDLKDRLPDTDATVCELAENIIGASKYGRDLTSKLLSFARMDAAERLVIDIHSIIMQVITLLSHTIDKKITIKKELNAHPSKFAGDPVQLQNAFLNIALNGADAMQETGGDLLFKTDITEIENDEHPFLPGRHTAGPYMSIEIIDTGKGMSDYVKKRMFEPFFTTKPVGKGTGLGLSTAYGIIQAHFGIIEVQSRIDHGTNFTIYLPLFTPEIR
jgi:PAS domain S-box-containing protein